jgi:hypothetical protein
MTKHLLLLISLSFSYFSYINAQENRWQINQSGGISWKIGESDAHKDRNER